MDSGREGVQQANEEFSCLGSSCIRLLYFCQSVPQGSKYLIIIYSSEY